MVHFMPKKYLLYIHNDKFQTELHKSELVNKLLANYYEGSSCTNGKIDDGVLKLDLVPTKKVSSTKWSGPLFKKNGKL